MGTSKATLSPPKGSSGDKATATVGFHVYPALQQVLSVGDLMLDKFPDMPPLSETDDFYTGYKFEIWEGDTLLAQQRVHEYVASSHTFILKVCARAHEYVYVGTYVSVLRACVRA